MCLLVDRAFSDRWLAEQKAAGRTKVVCWKILWYTTGAGARSELRSVMYEHSRWTPGWKRSGRRGKPKPLKMNETVNRAIHVYLDKPRWFRRTLSSSRRIVPVTCYVKDFLAANDQQETAAFVKVFLAKEDYDKALGVR